MGSVVAITDASGTLTSQQRYLPFGQVRTNVTSPNSQAGLTDLSYTGQRDLGMGLMDYKARFYSPTLGRFTQPDTLIPGADNPQAWNRFSYVMNSPILYNDPSGHMRANENGSDGKKGCADRDYCEESQRKSDEEREARKNAKENGGKKVDAFPYEEKCGDEVVGCMKYPLEDGTLYALHYGADVDSVFVPTGASEPAALSNFISAAEVRSDSLQTLQSAPLKALGQGIVFMGGVTEALLRKDPLIGGAVAVYEVTQGNSLWDEINTAKTNLARTDEQLPKYWDAVKALP